MGVLELRIPKYTDSGSFDTVISYKEKNYELDLNLFLSTPTQPGADFFATVTGLKIFYDDQPLTIPEGIAANLLKYLIGFHKAYNTHSEFTCHQFAFLLTTGNHIRNYGFSYSSATHANLTSGEIVHFVTQKTELSDYSRLKSVHSALYLGNGFFFSKNGRSLPVICTLEAMLNVYPCDYIAVVTNSSGGLNDLKAQLSIYLSFKNKAFVQNGLVYRVLNTKCMGFSQMSPQAIRYLYKQASLKFHPDKTTLPPKKASVFLDFVQKIHQMLMNPIQRSEYNVSLLAGNDWSIPRILNLSFDSVDASTVKHQFRAFIDLLKFYGNLTREEERRIKKDPKYRQTVLRTQTDPSDEVVVRVSTALDRFDNQAPYHPAAVVFAGQTKYLSETLYFTSDPTTRIGDLRIDLGVPINICFNKHTFIKSTMKSRDFRKMLPAGLFKYSDVKAALELLEWWSTHNNPIALNSDYLKKMHLIKYPGNLSFFVSTRGQIYNIAVFLGGNFYLYQKDKASKDAYIANVASINTDPLVQQIVCLTQREMLSTQKGRERLFKSGALDFTDAEYFPRFSHGQVESFKRYLLNFLKAKDYQFVPYLNGVELDKGKSIAYNLDPRFCQYILLAGQSVLLCKNTAVIGNAFHLGNYLFVIASTTGYLRIANLLMLSETVDWDTLFVMKELTPAAGSSYKCEILAHRTKIPFESIQQPLLYSILGIPFDLVNLSMIDEQVVAASYKKRVQDETDSEVLKVINRAYKLLMNDYYRVFYGIEIIFGDEPKLKGNFLLDIHDKTKPAEIVKRYTACLKLINNQSLKDRISNEYCYRKAKEHFSFEASHSWPTFFAIPTTAFAEPSNSNGVNFKKNNM